MFSNPSGFTQNRAVGNLNALPNHEADHLRYIFSLPIKDLLHAISCMTPITGCKGDLRHIKQLEVAYDLEKAFRFRSSVISRIKTALSRNTKSFQNVSR